MFRKTDSPEEFRMVAPNAEITATNTLLMGADRRTIVRYDCGCDEMLNGVHAVGDFDECDDHGGPSVITVATVVGIVDLVTL